MWRAFFVVTVAFYTLLRLFFLAWNWDLYSSLDLSSIFLSFLHGLRFDLSAVAFLSLPALVATAFEYIFSIQKRIITLFSFLILHGFFLILNLGEIEYVKFNGRRMTLQSFAIISELQGKLTATFLSFAPLLLLSTIFFIAYMSVLFVLYFKIRSWSDKTHRQQILKTTITAFVILIFTTVAARGGLQKKPLGFAHTQVFSNSSLNLLTLNSSFTLLQSLKRTPLKREHYMSSQEMLQLMNGHLPRDGGRDADRGATPQLRRLLQTKTKQNVVVIIVESLTLDLFGSIHKEQGYVPFLEEISQQGLFFTNAFANGRRSIEGAAAILAGIPVMMTEPFISSQYATNTFYGIGTQLGSHGYSSAFYHGAANGSMYFDQFAKSSGIQKYFGANEYAQAHPKFEKDHDGTWGIWDEPFLQTSLGEIGKLQAPFAAVVFTLSSHTPFRVPKEYEGRFPRGLSQIHEVMAYTDYSLRKFFEHAKAQAWYPDTLFVITGDHTFNPFRKGYQNELGQYRVPLIFYHPRILNWPKEIDVKQPVQHIDILPSLTDFLEIEFRPVNLMGRSVFKSGSRFVTLYQDGLYHLITKEVVLRQQQEKSAEYFYPPRFLEGDARMILNHDLSNAEQENLTKKLQAVRQYFSEGLWDNAIYR